MLRRWWLVSWTALIVGAIAIGLAAASPGDAGLRAGIRATARTSLILFLLAFSASSIHALWRGPMGKWLLANRRYLGVSFAVSHAIHAALIAALAVTSATYRVTDSMTALVGGLVGYAFIAAMTITSFDRPTRALGRRRWKLLHTTGGYVVYGIFALAYVGGAGKSPLRATLGVLVVAALVVRIVARSRAR